MLDWDGEKWPRMLTCPKIGAVQDIIHCRQGRTKSGLVKTSRVAYTAKPVAAYIFHFQQVYFPSLPFFRLSSVGTASATMFTVVFHCAGVMQVSAAGMASDLTIQLPSAPACKSGKQDAGVRRQIRLCAESVSSMQVEIDSLSRESAKIYSFPVALQENPNLLHLQQLHPQNPSS